MATASMTLNEQLARWALALRYEDLPADVEAATRLRILDIVGLALSGSTIPQGRRAHAAALRMGSGRGAHTIGFRGETSAGLAALVNGTTSHAQEYCDTHNETFTHPSSPVVSAMLPLAEASGASGKQTILCVAIGIELACRISVAAPGMFHRHGFQTSSIHGIFGIAYAASRMLGLPLAQTMNAAGLCGTQAAGLLECFSDGSWAKSFSPGWAGHSAIAATCLAAEGFSGPASIFEGRFGLFRSHVQDAGYAFAFDRTLEGLGVHWESRNISFKPYPAGHFIHPFLDAALELHERGVRAGEVERIVCSIAGYMVPMVCEPVASKRRPGSDWHARLSLQYCVAEALSRGALGAGSFSPATMGDPQVLALADKVDYAVDPDAPPQGVFAGRLAVRLKDGRTLEASPARPWGSRDNPVTAEQVESKFHGNASLVMDPARSGALREAVLGLARADGVSELVRLATPG